jgi:hypothetical protein
MASYHARGRVKSGYPALLHQLSAMIMSAPIKSTTMLHNTLLVELRPVNVAQHVSSISISSMTTIKVEHQQQHPP